MTESEVATLVNMNCILYKNIMKPLSDEETASTIKVWHYHFKDFPDNVVKTAYMRAHKLSAFPIQPADIFKQLKIMAGGNEKLVADLWDELMIAVKKADRLRYYKQYPRITHFNPKTGETKTDDGTQELKQTFESLSKPLKAYLGNQNALTKMAIYTDEELERFERKRFQTFCEESEVFNQAHLVEHFAKMNVGIGNGKVKLLGE